MQLAKEVIVNGPNLSICPPKFLSQRLADNEQVAVNEFKAKLNWRNLFRLILSTKMD